MSSNDQAAAAALAQVALACDGAFLGITLAIVAVQTILKFKYSSKALAKIRGARSLSVSDIRSVVPLTGDDKSPEGDQTLVVVRGRVQPRSAVEGNWIGLRDNVLVSTESGERAVVIQRTQTCLYNEWRGLFGWTFDLHNIFLRTKKAHESTSLRAVPFILTDGDSRLHSCYVVVNLDGSKHPLPLTTVYHQLHPVHASPYTFFQAMFGHGYPVGLLDEEKILPLGKEITAVGICNSQNGVPEIKSSKEIPYFLSEMNKEQMEVDLAINTKILLWSGIILGTVSFGILAYSIARNWGRFKNWRQQRQQIRERREATTEESIAEDESGDVPDGELCVICLMRRRSSAFIPCGHLVCCPRCAFSVECDTNPKCPVCRQAVRTCVRIYAS